MKGDELTCAVCGAKGLGIGFAHDCALVFVVGPNEDPELTCLLCNGQDHIPRELATSFYNGDKRVTVGLHRSCYERARVRVRTRR